MKHCFLLFFLTLFGFRCLAETEDVESVLRKKLLDGYDKTLSPFLFSETSSKELISLNLRRIRDLDEATSTLTTEVIIGMGWNDNRFLWNKTEYPIRYVGFPVSDVWTPRLWILNHVKPEEKVGDTRVLAFRNFVWVGVKYVLHTSCVPNLKYFPFDKQKCEIEIASITQLGEMMELNVTFTDILKYRRVWTRWLTENTRWKHINSSARQENKTLLDGQIVNIELFTLEIQRTTPLIAMAIMTPAVMSAILVLAGFWVSPTCPVRMGIAVTGVFVSTSTLFTLGKVLPVTGFETPIIVEYSATSLILTLLFTIHTCLISLAIRSTSPFPFPYYVVLERIPTWILRLLGSDDTITKETNMKHVLLYSELADTDIPQVDNSGLPQGKTSSAENTELVPNPITQTFSGNPSASSEWLKPMILLDKISFYVYILILVMYIVSVIIEE